jgi:hypothetical protein
LSIEINGGAGRWSIDDNPAAYVPRPQEESVDLFKESKVDYNARIRGVAQLG